MIVKCLSVKNPLSYFICAGIKDVENRTWKTKYRGPLYIHSSALHSNVLLIDDFPQGLQKEVKAVEYVDDKAIVQDSPNVDIVNKIVDLIIMSNQYEAPFYKAKAVIGRVDLIDIVQDSPSPWALKNQYHWILKNPVLFEKPLEYIRGQLRIYNRDLKIPQKTLQI